MKYLEDGEATDDYTMGYADVAGFRLGTVRPVMYFDPVNLRETKVRVHPLLVMECTLGRPEYMNLDYDQALQTCRSLIDTAYRQSGEIVLLWHNSTVTLDPSSYQRQLYTEVTDYVAAQ